MPLVPGLPTATSMGVAALRALYSAAPPPVGIVRDPFAARLLPWPLDAALRALDRRPRLALTLHRALRPVTACMSTNLPLRTLAIDAALEQAVAGGARQVVLLGSGLDARAWRCEGLGEVAFFELDREAAHAFKRRRLSGLAPRTRAHALVPVDFERDDMPMLLRDAGFSRETPSVWIWEGVIVYLTPEAIDATLGALARLSAPGSTLIATYTRPGFGARRALRLRARLAARLVGEPVRGAIETAELHARLERAGFRVETDEGPLDWEKRYWPAGEAGRGAEWERAIVAVKR
jgi:methyltransferase (TIGR00027 family)